METLSMDNMITDPFNIPTTLFKQLAITPRPYLTTKNTTQNFSTAQS